MARRRIPPPISASYPDGIDYSLNRYLWHDADAADVSDFTRVWRVEVGASPSVVGGSESVLWHRFCMRGLFIVFEGIDGSGKTTQAGLLATALKRAGRRVHTTYEPTTGPAGSLLRLYLERRLSLDSRSLPYLFAADRADHVYNAEHGILAALDAGIDVLCDRYILSTLAYQAGQASSALLETLNAEFPMPDVTFYMDVDPQQGMALKAQQRAYADVTETTDQQRQAALHFAAAIERHGERHKVQSLDAFKLGIDGCAAEIWQRVAPLLERG